MFTIRSLLTNLQQTFMCMNSNTKLVLPSFSTNLPFLFFLLDFFIKIQIKCRKMQYSSQNYPVSVITLNILIERINIPQFSIKGPNTYTYFTIE